ncbi:MAG: thioredoxin family protein [Flavobacteriales bacterium]|nr:thioredoxin family protein [Flavobacteriales bacterium]
MKHFLLLFWLLVATAVQAQLGAVTGHADPVRWSVRSTPAGTGQWDIEFRAVINTGWAVYSQEEYGMGPIPTAIKFDHLEGLELLGTTKENGKETIDGIDPIFDVRVKKFKGWATFTQRVSVANEGSVITGYFEYMACDDAECIFPDPTYFAVDPATGGHEFSTMPFDPNDERIKGLSVVSGGPILKLAKVDLDAPVIRGQAAVPKDRTLWTIFFLGFIGGLLALLTPCVFPMIPLTVSFFTKGSEDRRKGLNNAVTYGGFILLIYLVFSIPFHLLGSVNPEIFNEISTNPWLNVFFFVIFIVFAISFFGYFEITLPSSWVNRMDANASRFGGMIGIFFMALTLALVSFSCTGPILGSLLAGALTADGGAWQLTAGMGGFGLALALPFALFAMFPQWLNSLPRSGSWLNTVKVVLGFVELALAIKFLSNADLVMNWGLLPREIFIGLWILVGIGLALYLFGLIRFPHDSPNVRPSKVRLGLGIATSAFVIYLLPGITMAEARNLKLLSGFPPPLFYSLYPQQSECPLDLPCEHDLEEGFERARRENKPVMLDFTGWACVNCRKMEENVWPHQSIYDVLSKEYVLVSLYVDDKRELPKEDQFIYETSAGVKKPIITKGNKWATLQAENFISASQPLYVLLSPDGRLLTDPLGYTPNKAEYETFLRRGLDAMGQLGLRAERR